MNRSNLGFSRRTKTNLCQSKKDDIICVSVIVTFYESWTITKKKKTFIITRVLVQYLNDDIKTRIVLSFLTMANYGFYTIVILFYTYIYIYYFIFHAFVYLNCYNNAPHFYILYSFLYFKCNTYG